jgi:hypothetical protein
MASAVGPKEVQRANAHRRDAVFRTKRPLQGVRRAIHSSKILSAGLHIQPIPVGAPGSLVGTRRFCLPEGGVGAQDA